MKEHLLETEKLSRNFGGLVALNRVDMAVEASRISAVIGPNGAGKTTLFNLIAGVYSPSNGSIRLGKRVLNGLPPEGRVALGISRTFQDIRLFSNMTALENVMAGRHSRSRCGFIDAAFRLPRNKKEEEESYLYAMKYLNLVGLGNKANEEAHSIPFGQQKILAIARALASEPRLLLLDEPGSGLNVVEKDGLRDLILRIRDLGITVLLVEHDVNLVMSLAEWITVLDHGEKIAEGTPKEVQRDTRVITAYLGDEVL